MKLTSYNWPSYSRNIAYPASPDDYDEDAMSRFMKDFAPHVVSVKGVRYQFKAQNKISLIDFPSDESRSRYEAAYLAYLEAIGKIRDGNECGAFQRLVEDLKFSQAAEMERCEWFAERMYHAAMEGYAPVCAAKFAATIAKTVKLLVEKYGVKRDDISLIWGGSKTFAGNEKFLTTEEIHEMLAAVMRGEKVDVKKLREVRKQLLASQAGLKDLDPSLRLGVQSAEQRQKEIVNFQSGKSTYCLYTYKSGGVGLSLHHTDEYTEQKVRRKKDSNYAVEEDIPLIPTKPRCAFVAPTYSAIELVQGLGRCARITSLSNTLQTLVFFRGTIEETIAVTVSIKLKSLKQVVRKNESWQEMIWNGAGRGITPQKIDETELIDYDNTIGDVDEEDEEE